MSIEEELRKQLTAAIRTKDLRTANVIRMVNTKVMERRTAAGFSGQVDDALHIDVISAYKKTLEKARPQYEAAGERGREHIDQIDFEVRFLDQFLPRGLPEEEVRKGEREDQRHDAGEDDPERAPDGDPAEQPADQRREHRSHHDPRPDRQ